MNKKIIFGISIVINVFLALIVIFLLSEAIHGLKYTYFGSSTATDSMYDYLEWENYGVAARAAHSVRGGAKVADVDLDYYRLGEYADLLFFKEIYEKSGNTDTLKACEDRMSEIRSEMPDYEVIFEKIDYSVENAIFDNKEDK